MTRGLNKVMLIGRLGKNPKMRHTSSGTPVTNFSLAITRTWKSSSGEVESKTEWFSIVAWGNLAEICNQYLTKGKLIYIEGRLQTQQWEDEKGNQKSKVEIVAKDMVMLGSNSNSSQKEELVNEIGSDNDENFEEFPF